MLAGYSDRERELPDQPTENDNPTYDWWDAHESDYDEAQDEG
jgi:hypothetical protein